MKKIFVRFSILVGVAALGFGIYKYYSYQLGLAMQYCYKIVNAKILSAKKDNITIQLFLKIQNKSSFALNLKGYDLNVFLNTKKIANIKSDKPEVLANNAVSDLTLMISFNPSKFFNANFIKSLLLFFLIDKSKIVIDIQGSFQAKMNFIGINLPVNMSLTLEEIMASSSNASAEKKKTKCNL